MKNILSFILLYFFTLPGFATPITSGGQSLAAYLDSLDVEHKWAWGEHVDWRTGIPDGKDSSKSTSHCSAFVAGATAGLNIYILRPPEHPTHLLANAQYQWLKDTGSSQGWFAINTPQDAQRIANQGCLVVAAYQNPDPNKHGHIAIVRPSDKSDTMLQTEGVQVTQAGNENYNSTTLLLGFHHHIQTVTDPLIIYYGHATSWCTHN